MPPYGMKTNKTKTSSQLGVLSESSGLQGQWSGRIRRLVCSVGTALGSVVLVALCGSCQPVQPGMAIPSEAIVPRASGNLSSGDVIRVSFPGAPELNVVQRIQPDGRVSLPTIGGVSAAGRSVSSVQSQLHSMYQPHLQDPTVLVAVETAASGVYVSGEVLRPGKVPLDRPMTALEAVMEAGGYTKMANPRQVVIVRNEGGQHNRFVVNMSMTGGASPPFYVKPYDMIHVTMSRW